MLIEASDHETSEIWLLDRRRLRRPRRAWSSRARRSCKYDVEHHGDDLIILTNADGAEDFKIVDGARRDARARRTGAISCPTARAS